MTLLDRARTRFRERGAFWLLKNAPLHLYNNAIRPRSPRRQTEYNGVNVKAARPFDGIVPGAGHPNPEAYEAGLISGIRKTVTEGDSVTLIGGGWGVSAAAAAKQVGPEGSVVVYEGSAEHVELVRETTALNDVQDRTDVRHRIVSKPGNLRGDSGDASVILPSDLEHCDVLVVDCNGAEVDILRDITIIPKAIVVEIHEHFGASRSDVKDILTRKGYHEDSCRLAEDPPLSTICEEKGVYVMTATREGE